MYCEKFNLDFFCGYSPERINPGDKKHKITDIKKVTSGSNELIANLVDDLYRKIIPAGTHKAKSIKIAEAAKIIENTQRDLNIALINELSIIFQKMNIDTQAVLEAAETKWNFSSYRPGLVGGHCIGVDPYYLTYKSEEIGYKPEIILAGRKINDNMPKYISKKLLDEMEISVVTSIGSSLKVTEIASGEAEIYVTTTNKMKQWDTCASNCIISEAGGKMTDISGKDMVYNTESVNHENGILVTNGLVHQIALDAVSRLDS